MGLKSLQKTRSERICPVLEEWVWGSLPTSSRASLLQSKAQPERLNFGGKRTDLRDLWILTSPRRVGEWLILMVLQCIMRGDTCLRGICGRWFGKAVPGGGQHLSPRSREKPHRDMARWALSLYTNKADFCRTPLSPLWTVAFHSVIFHTVCNSLKYTTPIVVILCDTQL